jgi:hypothetical protein
LFLFAVVLFALTTLLLILQGLESDDDDKNPATGKGEAK